MLCQARCVVRGAWCEVRDAGCVIACVISARVRSYVNVIENVLSPTKANSSLALKVFIFLLLWLGSVVLSCLVLYCLALSFHYWPRYRLCSAVPAGDYSATLAKGKFVKFPKSFPNIPQVSLNILHFRRTIRDSDILPKWCLTQTDVVFPKYSPSCDNLSGSFCEREKCLVKILRISQIRQCRRIVASPVRSPLSVINPDVGLYED